MKKENTVIINADILKKVKKKEKENNYIKHCLAVRICPSCGEVLNYEYYRKDGGSEYTCSSCNFTYSS